MSRFAFLGGAPRWCPRHGRITSVIGVTNDPSSTAWVAYCEACAAAAVMSHLRPVREAGDLGNSPPAYRPRPPAEPPPAAERCLAVVVSSASGRRQQCLFRRPRGAAAPALCGIHHRMQRTGSTVHLITPDERSSNAC